MKSIIFKTLFTALALTFVVSVSAQEPKQNEQKTEEELAVIGTEALSEQLDYPMTPEQKGKVEKINLDFFKKVTKLKEKKASDSEFIPIYQEREEAMQSTLTQKQFKAWKENPKAKKIKEEIEKKEKEKNK
jgi:hypothetical protein